LGEDAKVLAGGQSLLPMLNLRVARPAWLVDLNPVGAGPIEDHGGHLRLPALTRHRTLEAAEAVRRRCPILAAAAGRVGNVRTRAPRAGWSFQELSRRSGDWMVVGVAALLELDADGAVAAASVTFGGVAERPWPVPAEALAGLLGAPPAGERLARVADAAAA